MHFYLPKSRIIIYRLQAGDLTRNNWNLDGIQALRPSIDEIIDSYIPHRLPVEHRQKPIVICLCFGGNIQEQVRTDIEGFIKRNTKKGIKFGEWDGDKLAELISIYFLREDLLPKNFQSLLRKSIALLDEPEVSYKHFTLLVDVLVKTKTSKKAATIKLIRQLNICLWILYVWCREANNLESAFVSSEYTLLQTWEITRPFLEPNTPDSRSILENFGSVLYVYEQISSLFLKTRILPYVVKLHAISSGIQPSCNVDVNLKLFDVLGRLAMGGIFANWKLESIPSENNELITLINNELKIYTFSIRQLIENNPMLLSPYRDNQAIDIALAMWFLCLDHGSHKFLHNWLIEVLHRVRFNFATNSNYPCNLHAYHELLEHPSDKSDAYRNEMTAASILYPTIATFSAILGFDDIYSEIQDFKNTSLTHCNFQFWYPDETTEDKFYTNHDSHGATLSHLKVEKTKEEFLAQIFKECHATDYFKEMSAVKFNFWPLILIGCRHYRLPIPVDFFETIYNLLS